MASSDAAPDRAPRGSRKIVPLPYIVEPDRTRNTTTPDPSECESVDLDPPAFFPSMPAKPERKARQSATAPRKVNWSDSVGKKLCEVRDCGRWNGQGRAGSRAGSREFFTQSLNVSFFFMPLVRLGDTLRVALALP